MSLKWSELPEHWQECWILAWEAYCHGSVPIGAVVVSPQGEIVTRGRNHIHDGEPGPGQRVTNSQLAHAELNALLEIPEGIDLHSLTIYSLIEPCPLCMGAIYMSGVRTVEYAGPDPYAGSTNLLGKTWYLARKPVRANRTDLIELSEAAVVLHTTYLWQRYDNGGHVVERMAWEACPRTEMPAQRLIEINGLAVAQKVGRSPAEVFDQIKALIEEFNS